MKEYAIIGGDVRIEGVIYSTGEVLPATISKTEIASLVGRGLIAPRVEGEVVQEKLAAGGRRQVPETSEGYLFGSDPVVVGMLIDFHPPVETLDEVASLAERTGRSPMLVQAIRLGVAYGRVVK